MGAARLAVAGLFLSTGFFSTGSAQTTQGVIAGEVRDSVSDQPISGAKIAYTHLDSTTSGGGLTGYDGSFLLPLLSPGTYRLEVSATGYQAQEINDLALDVGGKLSLEFRLRPLSDVWELKSRNSVVARGSTEVRAFYGPDVNPNRIAIIEPSLSQESKLDSSVSYVIDSQLLETLPLLGRDVYSQLVLLPGVSAYTGTGRGVNVSVAGQRPSSSNFLLDGIENNNALITGPLAPVPPESIQEYRISTNNYSVEYGNTGSFVANAISRGAGSAWHGQAYSYGAWKVLNANDFQRNTAGLARLPQREIIPGGSLGGPIIGHKVFTQLSIESKLHSAESDPLSILLPTKSFVASLSPGSDPARLLAPYLGILPAGKGESAIQSFAPPANFNQFSAVSRTDYVNKDGTQRLFLRILASRFSEPSLIFNPYPGLSSDLLNNASSVVAGFTKLFSSSVAAETRLGINGLRFSLDRPHAELPQIQTTGTDVYLPGSRAAYGLTDKDRTFELSQNVLLKWRNHFFKLGGGWQHRRIDSSIMAGLSGSYTFQDLDQFALSQPINLLLTYARGDPDPAAVPNPNRSYAYSNFSFFLQDSYQVSHRLTLNYGLRYEFFGSPQNTGPVKDQILQLGLGSNIEQRIGGATFVHGGRGDQPVYSSVEGNWAGRFALSFDPFGNGKSALRAGYGLFYDRPFDNFWQTISNNSIQKGFSNFTGPVNFLSNPRQIAAANPPDSVSDYFEPVLFQPSLRAAQIQSFFADAGYYPAEGWAIELRGLGTLGRRLTTTDQVNRDFSVAPNFNTDSNGEPINPNGKLNPSLETLFYRGNQGKSDYLGGSAIVRHRGRLTEWQASYTWSHAIDNQSDPLAGAFSNFNFISTLTGNVAPPASFTRQFDSQGDRASADFDQRHNLVFYFSGQTPGWGSPRLQRLTERLQFGVLGAVRSGFPFSALAFSPFDAQVAVLQNNRADLITSPSEATTTSSIAGGRQLLNPSAFATPAPGLVGNTGRNAFGGPGLFNFDLSVSREFSLSPCNERCRIMVRADAFNVLNHANLNNPYPYFLGTSGFGAAYFGRIESSNGFPLEQPLSETARYVQLMVRFRF
jgi:hypothetical protein